jgi:hypothetical protein
MMEPLSGWSPFPCKSDLDIEDHLVSIDEESDDEDDNTICALYPCHIYNSVVAIQAEMKCGLNVYTEKQGQPLGYHEATARCI